MPKRLCLEPRCPEPAATRGRCPSHQREHDQSIHRAGKGIYSTKRWQATRRAKLWDDPICEVPNCKQIATDVHHIRDLRDGGEPYDLGNLQSLCRPHHSQETRRRQTEGDQHPPGW